jgi:hypothetical protein
MITKHKLLWALTPVASVLGFYFGVALIFNLGFQCLHFGGRPADACPVWWEQSHVLVAIILGGFVGSALAVGLAALIAPSYKFASALLSLLALIASTLFAEGLGSWILVLTQAICGGAALLLVARLAKRSANQALNVDVTKATHSLHEH